MCDRYATEASNPLASVGWEAGVAEKKANAPRSTTSSSVAGAAASGMRKETYRKVPGKV